MEPKQNQPAKNGGYGKRPLWQWVVIYIIVAIVVYGIAFLVYRQFNNNSSSSGGSSSSSGLY